MCYFLKRNFLFNFALYSERPSDMADVMVQKVVIDAGKELENDVSNGLELN